VRATGLILLVVGVLVGLFLGYSFAKDPPVMGESSSDLTGINDVGQSNPLRTQELQENEPDRVGTFCPWPFDDVRWAVQPRGAIFGDLWFVGIDGDIAVCQQSASCSTIPDEVLGVCDGFGCVRTQYELYLVQKGKALFRTGEAIPYPWTPFPRTIVFDGDTGKWESGDYTIPLTEHVDFGWMVGSEGNPTAELATIDATDSLIAVQMEGLNDATTGQFMPPWVSASYGVVDGILTLSFHRTMVGENVSKLQKQQADHVGEISIMEDGDVGRVDILVPLERISAYSVTFEVLSEEAVLLTLHLQ